MTDFDFGSIMKMLAVLSFVIALMGGFALLLKKLGLATEGKKSNTGRLKIVESLPIDTKRKAVIIRRDTVEHLLILGQNSEIVVETIKNAPAKKKQTKT